MERNETIVYLGTENNAKSCLGLKEILEDGWNVKLVIAYDSSRSSMAKVTPLEKVKTQIKNFLNHFPNPRTHLKNTIALIKTKKISKPINFNTMETICNIHNILYKPTSDKSLKSLKEDISRIFPAVILSNGWMFKISEDIISIAQLIALNCHSSYLPEYRGGNITFAPLINEESQSGITVHQLYSKFDAGPILAQTRILISPKETPRSLNVKRAKATGRVLIKALNIAGKPYLYKPNPPSPFYFRCDYATYMRYKRINYFRKLIGLPIKRYEPQERYDI